MITQPRFTHSLSRGFTLVEILIVIAIITILGIPAFAAYTNYNTTQTTVAAISDVVNALQTAKSQALSVYVPTGCTSLQSYDFVITPTSTYKLQATCLNPAVTHITIPNSTKTLPNGLTFTTTTPTISFSALTGSVASLDTITINASPVKTITVTTGGAIQVSP